MKKLGVKEVDILVNYRYWDVLRTLLIKCFYLIRLRPQTMNHPREGR